MGRRDGKTRVVIMGAGGRDFHNFNVLFRDDPGTVVVAFTAAQIPFQQGRRYPASLAGPLYPEGIPIVGEKVLPALLREEQVDEVILAYSDLSHQTVMETASRILAFGADFRLVGPERTMLRAGLPVISVCAVRTGCGKSPVTRYLCRLLLHQSRRPVVVRHPMAYGRLDIRQVEQIRTREDLDRLECTLEEREEFEPLLAMKVPLFAGVDYRAILEQAEKAGDILVWDGGNNDFPFYRPDLEIVLADPFRVGDEAAYYPGLVNLLRAQVVIIAKARSAAAKNVARLRDSLERYNPQALIVEGDLEVQVKDPSMLRGRRVVVIEDGPTLTHGGMPFGAGVVAARRFKAAEIVDPRPFAVGSLAAVYREYPHLEKVVPAMGYSEAQLDHLRQTLEKVPCDLILCATPVNLAEVLELARPVVQVTYEFVEEREGRLRQAVREFLREKAP